jgi:hypothetical protein
LRGPIFVGKEERGLAHSKSFATSWRLRGGGVRMRPLVHDLTFTTCTKNCSNIKSQKSATPAAPMTIATCFNGGVLEVDKLHDAHQLSCMTLAI